MERLRQRLCPPYKPGANGACVAAFLAKRNQQRRRPQSVLYAGMIHRAPLRSVACSLAIFALLGAVASAQDPRIPPDGQPWRIERAADVPPALAKALRESECRQSDAMLLTFPIELFRPAGSRMMAIAPCSGITLYGRAYMFDGDTLAAPRALVFPVMPFPSRVNASEMPGVLAWNSFAKTLVALQGNDVCEGTVTRHTYRHDPRHGGDDLNGFALVKVERGKLGCNGASENWQVMWEN